MPELKLQSLKGSAASLLHLINQFKSNKFLSLPCSEGEGSPAQDAMLTASVSTVIPFSSSFEIILNVSKQAYNRGRFWGLMQLDSGPLIV